MSDTPETIHGSLVVGYLIGILENTGRLSAEQAAYLDNLYDDFDYPDALNALMQQLYHDLKANGWLDE